VRGPLRVAVVSRHHLTRFGLTRLLTYEPGRVVVVNVADLDRQAGHPDVAIYDLAELIETQENFLSHLLASQTPVVALEPYGRRDLAEGALAAGVCDVVAMDVTAPELLAVLERVAAGHAIDREGLRSRARRSAQELARLTDREVDVLELIGSGVSNREIAARLFISINTVKTHIRTLYCRIGVTRRTEAVLWAVRHDLPSVRATTSGEGDEATAQVPWCTPSRRTDRQAHQWGIGS
jgi:DNA-binding NarL/FixJ family response regulator